MWGNGEQEGGEVRGRGESARYAAEAATGDKAEPLDQKIL